MVTAVRHLKAWKAHIRQAPVVVGLLSFVWVALFASSGPDVCAAASQTSALQIAQQARTLAATGQVAEALTLAQQALALAQGEYGTDHEYVGYILDDIATLIYRLGKPDDALSYAQRAVNIVGNQRGADSQQYASVANNLGTILSALGRFHEAEQYYRQSYVSFLNGLGLGNAQTAQAARNLGLTYLETSQLEQAGVYLEQALEAYHRLQGSDNTQMARLHLDVAGVRLRQEDLQQARVHTDKAQHLLIQQRPVPSEEVALTDIMFARIAIQQSELHRAAEHLNTALQRLDTAGSKASLARASALYNLGFLHILRGQLVEAEPLLKQVLGLYRNMVGEAHPAIARTLHSLAIVYKDLGKPDTAEEFYQRALHIFTTSFGETDASVAATRLEYGLLLTERGEPDKAIAQAEQALSIYQRFPVSWDIKRAYAMSSLGFALHRAARLQEAARALEDATRLMAQVRGGTSSDLPPGLTELGEIYLKQGRVQDAEGRLSKAIAIQEKDASLTPQGLAKSLAILARLRVQQGQVAEALALAQRTIRIMEERLGHAQRAPSTSVLDEQRQSRKLFEAYLTIAHTYQKGHHNQDIVSNMFKVAQLPHLSGTAASVTRMAARFATQQTTLGQLIREHQDAVEQWRALDHLLTERLGGIGTDSSQNNVQELHTKMAELTAKISPIDAALRRDFPEYTELTNPRPVELAAVQQLLSPDEALLLHVSADDGTYVFLIRPGLVRVERTAMTKVDLAQAVASLRKGLDLKDVKQPSDLPPFDTHGAHYLYQQIFAPIAEDLRGVTHVIAVLDGAMQNLPPTVLLVSPAQAPPQQWSDYRTLDFIGRYYAFSVIPSVSSFKALRSVLKPSQSSSPFIGFGNPDFKGDQAPTRGNASNLVNELTTSIDPNMLRSVLRPLPGTGGELKALATALNAPVASLFLQTQATETRVKQLDLSQYSMIAFATHGLLAGEFRGLAEPALALTPPKQPTPLDDGLLTASEIASLKLNANWVILSACNTAGPEGRPGAEGLSGLAKAFFYAGSRALLVSHWAVASDATILLTTGAVQALVREPTIGRAEALRRSMLTLMNGESMARYAHPAFWAPFVNVGEGKR